MVVVLLPQQAETVEWFSQAVRLAVGLLPVVMVRVLPNLAVCCLPIPIFILVMIPKLVIKTEVLQSILTLLMVVMCLAQVVVTPLLKKRVKSTMLMLWLLTLATFKTMCSVVVTMVTPVKPPTSIFLVEPSAEAYSAVQTKSWAM